MTRAVHAVVDTKWQHAPTTTDITASSVKLAIMQVGIGACSTFVSKCAELDGRLTDNSMPYFPTNKPWTHVTYLAKIVLPVPALMTPTTGTWHRTEQ